MVAQLAEAAAEAIGANPIECRVEAYYHDIGKMQNPFILLKISWMVPIPMMS